MGRLYGGWDRIEDTVDLPVAIDPVRPRSSILGGLRRGKEREGEMERMDGMFCAFGNGVTWADRGTTFRLASQISWASMINITIKN